RMDGASEWGVFRHITLPLLRPVIGVSVTLSVIGSLKYFDLVYMMAGGAPERSRELMATYIYRLAFEGGQGRFGYGSAAARTSVKASHDTPYGVIGSAWTLKDGQFELVVDVPPNTSARVWLPGATLASVTEGGQPLAAAPGIKEPRQEGTAVLVEVGSGQYRFAYPLGK
nr:alpha-L-rhamnosidase C-terminal domain-containing protein [Vicinamibacterales bacterium]